MVSKNEPCYVVSLCVTGFLPLCCCFGGFLFVSTGDGVNVIKLKLFGLRSRAAAGFC